jgi:hypothetical protein
MNGLAITGIRTVSIEEGNSHFWLWGDFLMDIDGISVIRYFGSNRHVTIDCDVEVLSVGCFSYLNTASLTFESGSRLTRIESKALYLCMSLQSICLPASLESIDGSAFSGSGISQITVEEGNRHFSVSGRFLMDFEGTSIIRYFGWDKEVTVSRDVEVLGPKCFYECYYISSLTFEPGSKLRQIGRRALIYCMELLSLCIPASVEILCEECLYGCESITSVEFESGSKLTRIEAKTFRDCSQMLSICIPASIKELAKDWAKESALCTLKFESALSLQRMMQEGKADLSEDFDIKIIHRDCKLRFPGYDVGVSSDLTQTYVQLMRRDM